MIIYLAFLLLITVAVFTIAILTIEIDSTHKPFGLDYTGGQAMEYLPPGRFGCRCVLVDTMGINNKTDDIISWSEYIEGIENETH